MKKTLLTITFLSMAVLCQAQYSTNTEAKPIQLNTDKLNYHLNQAGEKLILSGVFFVAATIASEVMANNADSFTQLQRASNVRSIGYGLSGFTLFLSGRDLKNAARLLKGQD